ncbi:MAG TPA: hypothetical protein VFW96_04655 [Thermomicrobiales bacterium]|nr:hypothetical protein [Thermomicrobiales bacterium]
MPSAPTVAFPPPPTPTVLTPPPRVVLAVPLHGQQYPSSCEAAAASACANIDEAAIDTLLEAVDPDPNVSYRGVSPYADYDEQTGYGVYPPAMQVVLKRLGFDARLFRWPGGATLAQFQRAVQEALASGERVQLWWVHGDSTRYDYGDYVTYFPGYHSVACYGYDADGLDIMNPLPVGVGSRYRLDWDTALAYGQRLDNQMLAIYPQGASQRVTAEQVYAIGGPFLKQVKALVADPADRLRLFGLALANPAWGGTPGGERLLCLYTERAKLEYHLDTDGRVECADLGRRLLARGYLLRAESPALRPAPASAAGPADRYFPETGHVLRAPLRDFWEQRGGLAVFGYPLSEAWTDGAVTSQVFERALFTHDPRQPAGWELQLAQLGRQAQALGL